MVQMGCIPLNSSRIRCITLGFMNGSYHYYVTVSFLQATYLISLLETRKLEENDMISGHDRLVGTESTDVKIMADDDVQ